MHTQARRQGFSLPKLNSVGPKAFSGSLILGAYLLLHKAAENERIVGDATGTVGGGATHAFLSATASLLPLALLVVGLQSMLVVHHQRGTTSDAFATASLVPHLSAADCEQLVGETYRSDGYAVIENRGHSTDGGVDLVMQGHGKKIYAQCKHWTEPPIDAAVVQHLYAAMISGRATSGIVACSNGFTKEAATYAARHHITLVGNRDVEHMLGGVTPSCATPSPAR